MAEPVFYMRGMPPFSERLASPQMLEDLKLVAELSADQIETLSTLLHDATGFLNNEDLRTLIDRVFEDDLAQAVYRSLRNLEPSDFDRLFDMLKKFDSDPDLAFDKEVLDKLREKLPALIQAYPAIARYEKAEHLSTLTGQQLESIDLICDLRPIFDETREELEGMMPYTRLRIVATGADGLPRAFEAELSRQQVGDLAEKSEKAAEKVDALSDAVKSWIPGGLPDLPLTRPSQKDADDV